MDDVNAPSDQTPTMAPPVRADDQILPHIREKEGHSDCDSKHSVHQADHPPSSEEAQENVAKHKGFLAGETGSTQDLPAPKPTKPAKKPQSTVQKAPLKPSISSPATGTTDKPAKAKRIKRSASRKTRQPRSSPKTVGASEAEEVPAEELQVADEDADFQKAVEESMKDAYALPNGLLPPVVIREPESRKYQPLTEVPGKGKAKVSEEQTGSDTGAQAEGQAGSNPDETSEGHARSYPDETSEGQARPDPGNAKARVQSTSSP
nr:hypothetical protein [Tanacetum cinerariifolium]